MIDAFTSDWNVCDENKMKKNPESDDQWLSVISAVVKKIWRLLIKHNWLEA